MMDRGDHMDNNDWWWLMGIMGLLIVIALIVVLVTTLQRSNPSNASASMTPGSPRKTAEDLLSERFARGEIDEDEYRRRRDALRE
jgi:putative membrane protein